jgi:acetolactate synthase-1/2/3 large subunit
MAMRVADYIINRIYNECAKHIFTVTGRGILYLTDAVAKHGGIVCVPVHHEQAGAFAAAAYGSYTGKPGACLVSTGCAGTNTITALLNAYQDGVPCLFVSGNNQLRETVGYTKLPIRTFGSQETDIVPLVKPITKYAAMLADPKQTAYELDKALHLAGSGAKGPVWLDIPLDIQSAMIEPEQLERFRPDDTPPPSAKSEDMVYITDALNRAKRPVVLIGSGVRSAGAVGELKAFIEKYAVPLTCAHSAVDVYGLANDLSIGTVGGMHGTRAGNFAVQNADLLLVLGCRLTSMTTGADKDKFVRGGRIIVVDINPTEFMKNTANIDRIIAADVKDVLTKLNAVDITQTRGEWVERCRHWKNVFPKCEEKRKQAKAVDLYYLADRLSATLPDKSAFLVDAGLEDLILPGHMAFKEGMRVIKPHMQGSMGFALPAAIGAYYASGETVCAVIGDGSMMMNLQELATVAYRKIPLKLLVVNNNMYAIIRKRQEDLFRTRTIATDPKNGVGTVDFRKAADCFGLHYILIDDSADLERKLTEVFAFDGAVLCEIIGLEDQEFLSEGYTRTKEKRYVQRPLEDQAPFMDRELFLKEMLIEPIDQ